MRRLILLVILLLVALPVFAQDVPITFYDSPQAYTVTGNARARSCPLTSCAVQTVYRRGNAITVLGTAPGTAVGGNTLWLAVQDPTFGTVYVHNSLARLTTPANLAVSTPVPNPPLGSAGATCPNRSATCTQLTCAQAQACLAAGNRRLDRDNDGVPCENVCPGG